MTEEQLDDLTGKVFATPEGKAFLAAFRGRSAAWASVAKDVDKRVGRMRRRWGDLTTPTSPAPHPSIQQSTAFQDTRKPHT